MLLLINTDLINFMPYVKRKLGKVVGICKHSSPDAQEFLCDDHPEVVEYLKQHSHSEIKPLTPEEREKLLKETVRTDEEGKRIRDEMVSFFINWNNLETALSCLLYEILNIHPRCSRLAYSVYYSLTGFDARINLMDKVIKLFIEENKDIQNMLDSWKQIYEKIISMKKVRNTVAHGAPITFVIRSKHYVRIAPPAFDINRIGIPMNKGSIPGYSVQDMQNHTKYINALSDIVDDVNRAICSYHEKDGTFPEKLQILKDNLQKLNHSQSGGQNSSAP